MALTCWPDARSWSRKNETFPLHIFAHGNGGGGYATLAYEPLLREIASFGFVAAAYESCTFDSRCANGESQLLEAIKTMRFFLETPAESRGNKEVPLPPIDKVLPVSVSGHSTGARAALMLAAARDTPAFLAGPSSPAHLTPDDRSLLQRIACVVGDHPDPMYDPAQDPDIGHFNVTKTPTMLVTGTLDVRPIGEPRGAAWRDFTMLGPGLRDRVFVNIEGASHLQPITTHPEGRYIALFSQYHALGNVTAGAMVYGDARVEGSIASGAFLTIAGAGAANNGGVGQDIGFLACGGTNGSGGATPQALTDVC
jgi:hypothetical protein